jgi:hypothetical protein
MAIHSVKISIANTFTPEVPYRLEVSLAEDTIKRVVIVPEQTVVTSYGIRLLSRGQVILPVRLKGWSNYLELGGILNNVDLTPNQKIEGSPYDLVIEAYNGGAAAQGLTIILETMKMPKPDKPSVAGESKKANG